MTSGRLVVQPERSNRSANAKTMIAIIPTRLATVVSGGLPAVIAARVAVVNLPVGPVVVSRAVLGTSMTRLMIQVGMQRCVLVTRLRIVMSVVVDDVTVLSLMRKIRVDVGVRPTTVPVAVSRMDRTNQRGD